MIQRRESNCDLFLVVTEGENKEIQSGITFKYHENYKS
jgi:hypothetical protein